MAVSVSLSLVSSFLLPPHTQCPRGHTGTLTHTEFALLHTVFFPANLFSKNRDKYDLLPVKKAMLEKDFDSWTGCGSSEVLRKVKEDRNVLIKRVVVGG
jgi:hypothetical protein